jgi:preprotein translocase subunit SecE
VARDRQRAKQRKARRAQNPGPKPREPHRANTPGELDHASGEVDQFEAALVQGAGGRPVEPDEAELIDAERGDAELTEAERAEAADARRARPGRDAAEPGAADARRARPGRGAPEPAEDFVEEVEPDVAGFADEDAVAEADLEREAVGAAAPARRRAAAPPGAPTRKGAGRFAGFLRASWAELQRVQWPDRRQVTQATAVVIGFVIVAGLYLGVADYIAEQVVNAII